MEAFYGEEKNSGLLLPVLDPPLLERNFQQTRALAVSVVKASRPGMRRKVGWGDPEKKPEWWPGEAPWEKFGFQSGVTLQAAAAVPDLGLLRTPRATNRGPGTTSTRRGAGETATGRRWAQATP